MNLCQTFDDIVGQEKAKTVCKVLASASRMNNEPCSHILFSGGSGFGKSTMAYVFARHIGKTLHNINASTISNQKSLIQVFNRVQKGDIVFIDEIHALSGKTAESIYTILEEFRYFEEGKERRIPRFTCLGATNFLGGLPEALKNRFQFIADFEPYSKEELTNICLLVCQKRGFKLNKRTAELIANTTKGIPREAKNRVEFVRNFMIVNKLRTITEEKLFEIISLQGIDKNGLNNSDRNYIKAIGYSQKGVREIAHRINVDIKTVTNVIEPYLIEAGYVTLSSRGRELTQSGLKVFDDL